MKTFEKYILIWLLAIAGSQMANAGNKAWLTSYDTIDVCKPIEERMVTISLDFGEVKKSDSLFGCNFEIKYDTTKIRFESYLTVGTLSEFFEFKDATFGNTPGKISGFASQLNPKLPPIFGNKPLMAFRGYWRTECPDTSALKIEYIEFTDEYKGNIDIYEPCTVFAVIKENIDRAARVIISKNELKIEKDSTEILMVLMNAKSGNRLQNGEIEFEGLKKDSLEINIESADTSLVEISSIKENENKLIAEIKIKQEINSEKEILKVHIERKFKNGDTTDIAVKYIKKDSCSCVTKIENSGFLIQFPEWTNPDTSSYIENQKQKDENLNIKYKKIENLLILETISENISEIEIFNYIGKLKKKISNRIIDSQIEINISDIENGTYFLISKLKNGKIYKNIFIKY